MATSVEQTLEGKNNVDHREDVVVDEADHQMHPWQCMLQNPKIVLWTLFANVGACLIGYENLALSVCLAMPAFQMQFAVPVDGTLIIPAYWQSAWNAMYNVMMLFGSFAAGWIQDRLGRRSIFLIGAVIACGGIAIAYVAEDSAMFLGSKIVSGFAMGMVNTATQTYVSEIAPLPMRGIALSANTIMMNLGFLIAISSTYARVEIMDPSAFRVLFPAGWVFPGILLLGIFWMPESPYWLVMKSRAADASTALRRLSGPHEDLTSRLAQIETTIVHERRLAAEGQATSFLDCFRGVDGRRTGIILLCMYMSQVCGATLSSNAPYFLSQTGLSSSTVIMLVQIGISMGVASSLVNVYMMMRFRRRPLMFFGAGLCCAMYLVMGIASVLPPSPRTLLAIGTSLQFTSISYGPAVGSSMAVAGEVSSSRLRAKSLGIGNSFFSLYGVVWTIVLPYLFNQDEANLGGKLGWIFLAIGLFMTTLMYFYVPDTKGRTYEELDILFEKKMPARKFHKYQFDGLESA